MPPPTVTVRIPLPPPKWPIDLAVIKASIAEVVTPGIGINGWEELGNSEAVVGFVYVPYCHFTGSGGSSKLDAKLELSVDGKMIKQKQLSIDNVLKGEPPDYDKIFLVADQGYTFDTVGAHTIRCSITAIGSLQETDASNNIKTITVNAVNDCE